MRYWLLLCVLTLLAACADEPWQSVIDPSTGVQVEIPPDWVHTAELDSAESDGVVIRLADSDATLRGESNTGASGTLLIARSADFSGESDPGVLLGFFSQLFTGGNIDTYSQTVAPRTVTLNGIDGVTATYRSTAGLQHDMQLTTLAHNDQIVTLVMVDNSGGQFARTFERIQQTLQLGN